jgi:integrase
VAPNCPECGSERSYKDGLRYSSNGDSVQRFLCRECGLRFSERKQSSNTLFDKKKTSMDPFLAKGNENMLMAVKAMKTKHTTATNRTEGATKNDHAIMKGLLTQYMAYLEKEGYGENCRYIDCIRMLINSDANLRDPEHVKAVIAQKKWKNGTKMQATYAYDAMTKMLKISWNPPKYTQEEHIPWIPEEKELDMLIASCKSRRMATYLQTLKETFADPSEALRLRWIDISGNTITINMPVKGHRPRQIPVSNRLIAMLNNLPKTSETIFPVKYATIASCFKHVRKRAAQIHQNPRLLKISFVAFRHWGGTMIAQYTNGNVLTVQKLLGHKNIRNTMKYIGMINFRDDEFEVTTATTVEEAKKILSLGFNYITEKNGIMLFRRPKRFGALPT